MNRALADTAKRRHGCRDHTRSHAMAVRGWGAGPRHATARLDHEGGHARGADHVRGHAPVTIEVRVRERVADLVTFQPPIPKNTRKATVQPCNSTACNPTHGAGAGDKHDARVGGSASMCMVPRMHGVTHVEDVPAMLFVIPERA